MNPESTINTFHNGEVFQIKFAAPPQALTDCSQYLPQVINLNLEMDQVDQLITSLEDFKKSQEKSHYKLKPNYRSIYGITAEESFLNKYDSSCDGATLALSTRLNAGGFQTLFTEAEFNELITPDHELYGKLEKVGE